MKIQLTVLYLLSTVLLFCQNDLKIKIDYPTYYRTFNKISDLLEQGEFEKVVTKFDSIVVLVKRVPSAHYFKMARISAEQNHCELTKKYLLKSLQNGEEYGKGIRKHKTITGCESIVNELLLQEKTIHDAHFNYIYKAKIDSMLIEDQAVRGNGKFERMGQVDSMNMEMLLRLIEIYGYPSENIIGNKSAFNAYIMLLHMDRDLENKVFGPILNKAYNDGYLWPSGYAWIIDRRRKGGKKTVEPYFYHMPSPNYNSFSEEHKLVIDNRRDSIGLRPKKR